MDWWYGLVRAIEQSLYVAGLWLGVLIVAAVTYVIITPR